MEIILLIFQFPPVVASPFLKTQLTSQILLFWPPAIARFKYASAVQKSVRWGQQLWLLNKQAIVILSSQFRLDFDFFVITGPTTNTHTYTFLANGVRSQDALPNAMKPQRARNRQSTKGQCLTDTFSVTNPGGLTPPVICGIMTGEHCKRLREFRSKLSG